jgi:hypothetical protein
MTRAGSAMFHLPACAEDNEENFEHPGLLLTGAIL